MDGLVADYWNLGPTSEDEYLDELERRLQERLDALGPAPRAELLHVLMLPDFERADRSASSGATPEPHLRRAADRLRGGPDAEGGAGRDAAGG